MRKQIILFLILIRFIVLQPLPSFAQVIPQASPHVHMSMNNPTMHFQHYDGYQHNSTVVPAHHCGESQHPGTTLHHAHHYLWTHARAEQPDKQQQAQINLDLSSSSANMTAGHLLNGRTVTIAIGGQQLSVTNATPLTPGEYIAVMQIAHGEHQTILLNSLGAAIGGTVVINSRLSNELSSLTVPQGVTAIDLTSSGSLNLAGGIIDSGNLYVASFNPSLNSIAVNANNISVQTRGTFSDNVSGSILPSLSKADSNLNLNLNSANDINNTGTIVSGGNLTLNPGVSIVNTGLIQSTHGNINVVVPCGAAGKTLNVQSTGGIWQATSGNINIGYVAGANTANQSLNLNLTGGNFLSRQLNIDLGSGALAASVENLTGVVNANAGEARLVSSTPNLQIGNWNITGDPTITNDKTITLTGNIITNGAPVTIVSGQNVVSYNPITINTSSASGGNVNIIAGSIFTPDPYTSGNVNILGASAMGGSINLMLTNSGINTKALAVNSSGGNVILAAFAGATPGSGTITLPSSSTISTGGSTTGSPGHVYIIAGSDTGSASALGISIGTINTVSSNESGSPGASGLAGGHIVLATEQPNASINNPWIIDSSKGTSIMGGPLGGSTANAPISVTGITAGGGQIIVFSGMGITVGNNSTIGANVISTAPAANSTFPGGAVNLIANAYGNTSPLVNTDIVVNGNIVTSGPAGANSGSPQSGNIVAMTTGSVTIGNITTSNVSLPGGATGGSVYIVAGSPFSTGTITLGNIDTHSQYANAGSVELISMATYSAGAGAINVGSISTYSTNSNGAFITISSSGTVAVSGAIDSHGGNGNGGSLFIGSGAQSGTAINVANGSTINTSGTATAGGIYLLAGNAGDTITHGTLTTVPIEVISAYNPTTISITGNAGTVQIIFGTNSGTSTLSPYVPGGYGQINDQGGTPGNVGIIVQINNGDSNVNVPLVSLNSAFTLLGSPGSPSFIESIDSSGSQAGYSLLSTSGILVGSNNATLFSFPTFHTYIGLLASSHGTVDLNNSSGGLLQSVSVGLAASSSGPLSVLNNATLNISNTVSAASSVTLGSGLLPSGLILSGSVTSASAITLIGVD